MLSFKKLNPDFTALTSENTYLYRKYSFSFKMGVNKNIFLSVHLQNDTAELLVAY